MFTGGLSRHFECALAVAVVDDRETNPRTRER